MSKSPMIFIPKKMRFNIDIDKLIQTKNDLLIYWKDIDLNYGGCNEGVERVTGLSKNNIIGNSDYGFPLKKGEADSYRRVDQEVIQTGLINQSQNVVTVLAKNLEITQLSLKIPLFSEEGVAMGVLGLSTTLRTRNILENDTLNLSPRETQCLRYWMQGKSTRVIGAILGLSSRTVEFYLNNIKSKWNCHSKSGLITKALENGFQL